MLTIRSTINIAGQTVPQIIPVVQGDTGRSILFTLADFTIPQGSTATYYVQKPSGEAVYNAATIDGNTVLVELTAQSIIERGDNYGQVRIENDGEVVTSFDFILLVKPFRGIDATQSTTEMNIFDKAVEQAEEAIDEAKVAALEEIAEAGSGNIADEFASTNSYLAGEYTIYQAKLYRFTSNHTGAWTGSDAEEVTVGEELTDVKDGLQEIENDLDDVLPKEVSILAANSTTTAMYIDGNANFHAGTAQSISVYKAKAGKLYKFVSSSYSVGGTANPAVTFKATNTITAGQSAGTVIYTGTTTNAVVNVENTPATDGYFFVVTSGSVSRGTIDVYGDTYLDVIAEQNGFELLHPSKSVSGKYINGSSVIKTTSTGTIDVYPASKDITYKFTSIKISAANAGYVMIAFADNDSVTTDASVTSLFKVTTTLEAQQFSYTAKQNGYFYVVRFSGRGWFDLYKSVTQNTARESDIHPLFMRTVAVLGDSIMQNMSFSANPPTNVQTYEYNGVSYSYDELTNINGHLFTPNNNECQVVNSNQSIYDAQTWEKLIDLTSAKKVLNTSIGGSMINETDVITPYPGIENDTNRTICLPNLVRWLKRLTDAGETKPDCAVIWLGTNNIAGASGDFDEIMSLSWETLSDDANGRAYRKTTYGGLRYAIESLYRNYPSITIIVFSPIQSSTSGRTYTAMETRTAEIKKMAERYSCVFVDTLHTIGIVDFDNPTGGGIWLRDGLHPNDYGKELYAHFASSRLNSLYFAKPQIM